MTNLWLWGSPIILSLGGKKGNMQREKTPTLLEKQHRFFGGPQQSTGVKIQTHFVFDFPSNFPFSQNLNLSRNTSKCQGSFSFPHEKIATGVSTIPSPSRGTSGLVEKRITPMGINEKRRKPLTTGLLTGGMGLDGQSVCLEARSRV